MWDKFITWVITADLSTEHYVLAFLIGCLVGHILYWGFLNGKVVRIFGQEIEL